MQLATVGLYATRHPHKSPNSSHDAEGAACVLGTDGGRRVSRPRRGWALAICNACMTPRPGHYEMHVTTVACACQGQRTTSHLMLLKMAFDVFEQVQRPPPVACRSWQPGAQTADANCCVSLFAAFVTRRMVVARSCSCIVHVCMLWSRHLHHAWGPQLCFVWSHLRRNTRVKCMTIVRAPVCRVRPASRDASKALAVTDEVAASKIK